MLLSASIAFFEKHFSTHMSSELRSEHCVFDQHAKRSEEIAAMDMGNGGKSVANERRLLQEEAHRVRGIERQLLLQMSLCLGNDPSFLKEMQMDLHRSGVTPSVQPDWIPHALNVQELEGKMSKGGRHVPGMNLREPFLDRLRQRMQHQRSQFKGDPWDSYDPDADESFSEDFASHLRTALEVWAEGDHEGQNVSSAMLMASRSGRRARERLSRGQRASKWGRVPGGWFMEELDRSKGDVSPFCWHLPIMDD